MMAKRRRHNRGARNNKERFNTRGRSDASAAEQAAEDENMPAGVDANTAQDENALANEQVDQAEEIPYEEPYDPEEDLWQAPYSQESLDYLKQEDSRREQEMNARREQAQDSEYLEFEDAAPEVEPDDIEPAPYVNPAQPHPEDAELSFLKSHRPARRATEDEIDAGWGNATSTYSYEYPDESAPAPASTYEEPPAQPARKSSLPDRIGLEYIEIEPEPEVQPERSVPIPPPTRRATSQPARRAQKARRSQPAAPSSPKRAQRVKEARAPQPEAAPRSTSERALIEVWLVQEMDFRLSSASGEKKPSWKTNPFAASFTSDVEDKKLGAAFRQYPAWLASFMKNGQLYRNSACIKLVEDAGGTGAAKGKKTNKISGDFATEFAAALEPLLSVVRIQQRVDVEPARNFRIDEEHIIIDRGEQIEDEAAKAQEAIDVSGLNAWLFYDSSLRQWQIIYSFTLEMRNDRLNTLLATSRMLRADRADLYSVIRDLFCVSEGATKVSSTVSSIQQLAKTNAARLAAELYGTKKALRAPSLFTIPSDSTDVSLFIGSSDMHDLRTHLAETSMLAEREHNDAFDLFSGYRISNKAIEHDIALFRFGRRFSTILINDDGNPSTSYAKALIDAYKKRFMPLLFHSMLMKSYAAHTTAAIQQIEQNILADVRMEEPYRAKYYGALINSVEYANFENELFKRAAELDNELAYTRIEERWGIARSLTQMQRFAAYLSGLLNRENQKSSLTSGRKRNAVLVLIALLVLVVVVIIWGNDVANVIDTGISMASETDAAKALEDGLEALEFLLR